MKRATIKGPKTLDPRIKLGSVLFNFPGTFSQLKAGEDASPPAWLSREKGLDQLTACQWKKETRKEKAGESSFSEKEIPRKGLNESRWKEGGPVWVRHKLH